MTAKSILRLVLAIVFCTLTFQFVAAQDAPATYVVTSNQTVNARSCPRLSCGVVTHFASGETFEVTTTVEGDVVSGNNRWLEVQADSEAVYVHSSLASLSEGSGTSITDTAVTSVDMSTWEEFRTADFTLKAPSDWFDASDLLSDEKLLRELAKMMDEDPDALAEAWQDILAYDDAYLFSFTDGCWAVVWHEELRGRNATLQVVQAYMAAHAEMNGATVLSQQLVDLPAGSAARLQIRSTQNQGNHAQQWDEVLYGLLTSDRIYYLDFVSPTAWFSTEEPIMDAIASSFQLIQADGASPTEWIE